MDFKRESCMAVKKKTVTSNVKQHVKRTLDCKIIEGFIGRGKMHSFSNNKSLIKKELKQFAENAYSDKLMSILMTEKASQHYSLTIDTMSLFESNVTFAHLLFECPERALKLLNQAFHQAALNICNSHKLKSNMAVRGTIHVRLTALPNLPEIYRTGLPHCSDVGQFMCISGTVIRKTSSLVIEFRKLWRCKKCKYEFTIDAEVEKGYVFEKPIVCPNPEWCNGKNFTLLSTDVDPMYCKDYCEVKIQQQFSTLNVGSVPRSMWVILEDDLVDTCHPGNDLNVSGVLIQRWKPLKKGMFIDIDLVLFAHNVEVRNKMTPRVVSENVAHEFGKFWLDFQEDPLKGRDFILSSICPQVFGLYIVKLAVALILAGGVEKKGENSRIRGDSHLLLVGDPGTGKSQFLKFASKVCMRAVLTSGIGTTNAGLTVSAVKESGKWQLEAGALVLADGGVCCIDEFSCIKEQDKTCIHEAMEQQTISVAKAGLVCSLSTKCSILAATNPKGKYDKNLSLSENTALASPLLSRFDIILVLLDTYDENWDQMVSSYILGLTTIADSQKKYSWSVSKMRSYFSMIQYINPKVTPSCERVLQTYYERQRSLEDRNFARTTPRLLQSLIRLAEGHARLMFRNEVLIIDAVMAIILMESSMSGSAILDELTTLHTSFPVDPKAEYNEKVNTVLKLLNLEDLLASSENYGYSYQELCVNKLLSEVAVMTSESNKMKFSDMSHISNGSTDQVFDEHGHLSTESSGEDCLFDRSEMHSHTIQASSNLSDSLAQFESLQSFEKKKDFNGISGAQKNQKSIETGNSSESKKETVAMNVDEMIPLRNEVSTLSDLKNMFSEDFFQSANDSISSFKNLFKRKQTNGNTSQNYCGAPQTNSHINQGSASKEPRDARISECNSSLDARISSKNMTQKENTASTSPLPPAKRTFLEKLHINIKSPIFNFETANNATKSKEMNQLELNGAIVGTASSVVAQENIETAASTTTATHDINNRMFTSEAILNLIAPNSVTQTEQQSNATVKNIHQDKNEIPSKTSYGRQKLENRFQKFLFKGKSKKSETTPQKNANVNCVSSSAFDVSSEYINGSPKGISNILASQKAFKRIFSNSIKENSMDLDDPFF